MQTGQKHNQGKLPGVGTQQRDKLDKLNADYESFLKKKNKNIISKYKQPKDKKIARQKKKEQRQLYKETHKKGPKQIPNGPKSLETTKFFHRRDQLIRKMGYKTYTKYKDSELWNNIRTRVFSRDKGLCRICSSKATEVHHVSYDLLTLKGKRLDDLYALCRACHNSVEFRDIEARIRRNPSEMKLFTESQVNSGTARLSEQTAVIFVLDEEFKFKVNKEV